MLDKLALLILGPAARIGAAISRADEQAILMVQPRVRAATPIVRRALLPHPASGGSPEPGAGRQAA